MEINMPVSKNVLPYLYARLETIPKGIRNQLSPLQGYNPSIASVTVLERQIEYLQNERKMLLSDLINILLDSTYNRPDLVRELLENENNLISNQLLIASDISDSNYSDALARLNQIEITSQEIADWVQYHEIILSLYSEDKTLFDMDSIQLDFIMQQAYKCPDDYTSANAKSVVRLLYGINIPPCEPMQPRSSRKLVKDIDFVLPETDAWMEDNFPDPFFKETLINYYLPENSEGRIMIYDMLGRNIASYQLQQGEHTLQIIPDGWISGIYNCIMIVDGVKVDAIKMVFQQN